MTHLFYNCQIGRCFEEEESISLLSSMLVALESRIPDEALFIEILPLGLCGRVLTMLTDGGSEVVLLRKRSLLKN